MATLSSADRRRRLAGMAADRARRPRSTYRAERTGPPPSRAEVDRWTRRYNALARGAFGGVLPPAGRTVRLDLAPWRITNEAGNVLVGQWEPVPLRGMSNRAGWGTLTLFGDASEETLVHEMIHAALDRTRLPNGHGEYFQRVAADVGYTLTDDDLAAARRDREVGPSTACYLRP